MAGPSAPMRLLHRVYGAGPTHLLVTLGCLALGGYVALALAADPTATTMAWWFAGAVIAHDLVLFPLYTLADRSARGGLTRRAEPSTINYIRVPTLASGLLFLLFFPGILERGTATLVAATGYTHQPYLARWLLLTAAFFAASAVVYALQRLRRRLGRRHGRPLSRRAGR